MTIEEKLDQIIVRLKSIDEKLSIDTLHDQNLTSFEFNKPLRPTKAQLKNQRAVELSNRMDRQRFLSSIRSNIHEITERQSSSPIWILEFVPQSLDWFPKFRNPNAGFYQELKQQTMLYAQRVTNEGPSLIAKLGEKVKEGQVLDSKTKL